MKKNPKRSLHLLFNSPFELFTYFFPNYSTLLLTQLLLEYFLIIDLLLTYRTNQLPIKVFVSCVCLTFSSSSSPSLRTSYLPLARIHQRDHHYIAMSKEQGGSLSNPAWTNHPHTWMHQESVTRGFGSSLQALPRRRISLWHDQED